MSHPSVVALYGISSGCLAEAKYFGKEVTYLEKPPSPEHRPVVTTEFLKLKFWKDLLQGHAPVNGDAKEIWMPDKLSRLRKSCASYWGFDFVEKA